MRTFIQRQRATQKTISTSYVRPHATLSGAKQTSTGKPLPAPLRSQLEGRFGHNFAQVRVYPDDPSVEAQHADAVTRGWQISFAPGRWDPGTQMGQRLLAHELAHVVQQTRTGRPIGSHEAERQANLTATRLSAGARAPQLGAIPFGTPAAQPQLTQPQPGQPQIVPATLVEKLATDIERVVKSANLPGINATEISGVIAVLREYGNTGRVVWGDTDGAYGTYDHESDLITLSDQRFDINNPGPVATVAIFHEASHASRWDIGGVLADADFARDLSREPNEEGAIKAAINRELKYYREETLAHKVERGVLYSYFVETGVSTAEEAAKSLASFDPTTGQSAVKSRDRLVELLQLYSQQTTRDVDHARFLQDARTYALTVTNMPDLSTYLR